MHVGKYVFFAEEGSGRKTKNHHIAKHWQLSSSAFVHCNLGGGSEVWENRGSERRSRAG